MFGDARRDQNKLAESAVLLFLFHLNPRLNLLVQEQPKPLRDLGDRPFEFFLVHVLPPCHEGTAQTRAVPERN